LEEDLVLDFRVEYERDVLDILMESSLYFELPLEERQLLLKHIVSQ
jgi:hypothetical protein